jgi:hypothetical protein
MGYHLQEIPRGKIGEVSKITEEYEEFMDAIKQNSPILQLVELSDLIGAIDLYAQNKYKIGIFEIIKMTRATQSAFIEGDRN